MAFKELCALKIRIWLTFQFLPLNFPRFAVYAKGFNIFGAIDDAA
jgi:hypothetical protein